MEKTPKQTTKECLIRNLLELKELDPQSFDKQIKIAIALWSIDCEPAAKRALATMYQEILETQEELIAWFVECVMPLNLTVTFSENLTKGEQDFNLLLKHMLLMRNGINVLGVYTFYNEIKQKTIARIEYEARNDTSDNPFIFVEFAEYENMLSFVSNYEGEAITDDIDHMGNHIQKTHLISFDIARMTDLEIAEIYLNYNEKAPFINISE
jgi:hypothetical protein